MLGAQGLWAGRDLYRATPTVTRDLGFSGLIRRTAPFSRLLRHTRGCGGPILTRILTGLNFMSDAEKLSAHQLLYIVTSQILGHPLLDPCQAVEIVQDAYSIKVWHLSDSYRNCLRYFQCNKTKLFYLLLNFYVSVYSFIFLSFQNFRSSKIKGTLGIN